VACGAPRGSVAGGGLGLVDGGGDQGGRNEGQSGHGFSPHDKRKPRGFGLLSTRAEIAARYFITRLQRNASSLKRDEIRMNRHRALGSCLSMIFSENRVALFRIMLYPS
jgi:hypothetical protein